MAGKHIAGPGAEQAAPPSVLVSAEQVTVTTEVVPYARAVLRVETVREEVLVPVTVTRQRARVEIIGMEDGGAPVELSPGTGAGVTTDWVTLTAEEPVVTVRTVPTERVRLATSWLREDHTVSVPVSHEEVEVRADPPR